MKMVLVKKELQMESKVIGFDIDGTIADCEHRVKYWTQKPRNWKKFVDESLNDQPYDDILWLLRTLHQAGNTILIITARSDNEREITTKWLHETAKLEGIYSKLYMREAEDYRDDSTVKKEMLDQIKLDGYNLYMMFDDRSMVVEMWREVGIRCLQVREGDF